MLNWTFAENEPDSELRSRLDELTGRWADVESRDLASILKENRHRTVIRLASENSATAWILKKYRHRGAATQLRHGLGSSHARREYRALQRVSEWGLRAPRPLAFGEERKGLLVSEGALVMEEVPEAAPLTTRLVELFGRGGPEDLETARAALFAAGHAARIFHERGGHHPDLHGGNFLCSKGEPGLFVIDLHSCRFPGYVPHWLRRRGLSKVYHSFYGIVPRDELRWTLAGYLADSGDGPVDFGEDFDAHATRGAEFTARVSELEQTVQGIAAALERRRLRSRTRRCVCESTLFGIRHEGRRRIYHRRSFSPSDLKGLINEDEHPPAGASVLKRSRRGWVARVALEDDGARGHAEVVVKFRRYSWIARLGACLSAHPLRRAWIALRGFVVRELPAPEGLALVESRSVGLVERAWLIQEAVDGEALDRFLWDHYGPGRGEFDRDGAFRRSLAVVLGRLVRRLHDAGVRTHDLSPQNVLVEGDGIVSGEPRVRFVDLDDVRFGSPDGPGDERRAANLIQLGNLPEGHIRSFDLLRALRAYDGASGRFYSGRWIHRLRRSLLAEAFRTLQRMTAQGVEDEVGAEEPSSV